MGRNLDIDNIRNNENLKIIIAGSNIGISGFVIQETFKIRGDAVYEALFEQGAVEGIPWLGKVAEKMKKFGGITLKNKNETTLAWMQSKKPQFTLDLIFVATESSGPNSDPRKNMIKLLEGTFPTEGGGGTVMHPPWGYKKTSDSGKITVTIGKWFKAVNQVLTSVDFDISTQVVKNGVPLYCQGSISFEPYQDIFATEIASYFP